MSDRFKPFPCGACGGTVRMVPAKGEVREFLLGVRVPIPARVRVPRCDRCGDTYFSAQDAARVDAAVREVFLRGQRALYARCVKALRRAHGGVTLRQIESACGVTPAEFAEVMKGKRVASVTLTRLIEAFVACPGEFERYWQRAPGAGRGGKARKKHHGE